MKPIEIRTCGDCPMLKLPGPCGENWTECELEERLTWHEDEPPIWCPVRNEGRLVVELVLVPDPATGKP
jgi:hypothetical protein